MAKCEKCGEEYPDGTEHVCSSQEEQKTEAEEKHPQKDEDSAQE